MDPPQCQLIGHKMITVEEEPEERESALLDRIRRKQRCIQVPFGWTHPPITLLYYLENLSPLANGSICGKQVDIEEVPERVFDRAASSWLPIFNHETELKEQDARWQVEEPEEEAQWEARRANLKLVHQSTHLAQKRNVRNSIFRNV